jgi:DNA-binding GntR family transcriptional regulator
VLRKARAERREDRRQQRPNRAAVRGQRLFAVRMQTETIDLSEPARLLDQMKKLLDAGEIVTFYESDIAFHRALWNLARNEYLTQHLEQIVVPLFAFFIVVNIRPEQQYADILAAVNLHGKILQGLQNHSERESHHGMARLLEASIRFSSGEKKKSKNTKAKRVRVS